MYADYSAMYRSLIRTIRLDETDARTNTAFLKALRSACDGEYKGDNAARAKRRMNVNDRKTPYSTAKAATCSTCGIRENRS